MDTSGKHQEKFRCILKTMFRILESKGAARDFVRDLVETPRRYRDPVRKIRACTVPQYFAFLLLRTVELAALCGIVYLLATLPA